MAKTAEELEMLKEDVEVLKNRLSELSDEELKDVLSDDELDGVSGGVRKSYYYTHYSHYLIDKWTK